jgi:uncharacterized protein
LPSLFTRGKSCQAVVDPFFAYKIAHQGLKKAKHRFDLKLDNTFFGNFEHSQIRDADIAVSLVLDNTQEPYIADIELEGTYAGQCDQCAATIPLTIRGDYRLYIKFMDTVPDDDEINDTDIVFLQREEPEIDLTQYLYEFAHLSLPLVKTCEKPFATPFCDMEVKRVLEQLRNEEPNGENIDPRWSALYKLKEKKG